MFQGFNPKYFPEFVKISVVTLILILFSSELFAQENAASMAITGVVLIDGTGKKPVKDATIIIRNGKIACAGECNIPEGIKVIKREGKYVIPGLIDSHVHYSASGWIDSFPLPEVADVSQEYPYQEVLDDLKKNPERFHNSYLCSGVTAIFDTGGYPWVFDIRQKAANSIAPHYYTTGPLLSFAEYIIPDVPAAEDFLFSITKRENMIKGMDLLIKRNADGVNIHNIHDAVNNDVLKDRLNYIVRKAENTGIRSMAFSRSLEAAKLAIKAGVKILIYSIERDIVDEEFLTLAKENDLIYVPTLGVAKGLEYAFKGYFPEDEISLDCIDSLTRKKLLSTRNYYKIEESEPTAEEKSAEILRSNILPDAESTTEKVRKENLRKINSAGIKIAMGSSAGVPLLVHGPASHHEMYAMAAAGLSPMEVIVASTRNGALLIGNKNIGTIERGKVADLVILNSNPLEDIKNISDIEMVFRRGLIVR